ncbi:cytidylyltransferase domain-containing protein [Spirochaeta lutea]|uniref:cytidylyltransferase domain-containing protein n=1 Tax=Spirochaeta lutea TaxID=1480694 RepID=UPI00068BE65A|nr:hypothetical protein [Spirochaeta lutea]
MASKHIGICIQARCNSVRLPGKVTLPLGSTTILGSALQRLKTISVDPNLKSGFEFTMVVLTDAASSTTIQPIAEAQDFAVLEGDSINVLSRFQKAARDYHFDFLIRATADNPFVIHELIPEQILSGVRRGMDYTVFNALPYGGGVEFITAQALLNLPEHTLTPYDYEHVTPYIYNHPEDYSLLRLSPPDWARYPDVRITVDYQEDYQRIERIYQSLLPPTRESLNDTMNLGGAHILPSSREIISAFQRLYQQSEVL